MPVKTLKLSDDLEGLEISIGHTRAKIALQGAHLISFITAGIEHLWLSPATQFSRAKAIRGGVPICWPWFSDDTDIEGPSHGVARTALWELESSETEGEVLTLILKPDFTEQELQFVPSGAEVRYEIRLSQHSLSLNLSTRNRGAEAFEITEALHTYLPVSDIESAYITGLNNLEYLDKLKGFERFTETREQVYLSDPTDRIYLDSQPSLELIDPKFERITLVEKSASNATVVWNPGAERASEMSDLGEENYRSFVCIEAANTGRRITVKPGDQHELIQRFSWSSF